MAADELDLSPLEELWSAAPAAGFNCVRMASAKVFNHRTRFQEPLADTVFRK